MLWAFLKSIDIELGDGSQVYQIGKFLGFNKMLIHFSADQNGNC